MVVGDEQAARYFLRNLPIRMACRKPVDLVPPRLALDCLPRVNSDLFWPRLVELALRRASRAYLEAEANGSPACCLSAEEFLLPTGYHGGLRMNHRALNSSDYSVLSARIGSNPAAMRAGRSAAKNAA